MADWSSLVGANGQNCFTTVSQNGTNVAENVATIKCLEPLFGNIVSAVIGISGIALFLMLVSGGFTYLFAASDPKKLEQAQKTITTSILGLVIMVSSYLILRLIQAFTDVPGITTFTIPTF